VGGRARPCAGRRRGAPLHGLGRVPRRPGASASRFACSSPASPRVGDPLDFPGYGRDAAALLVERRVAGLGIDTLSVDAGAAADFPVHHTTLPAGLWHLEGLVGLDAVPDVGATVVAGALKLPGSSGTPARVLALLS
jgi:kynurenine formamidase